MAEITQKKRIWGWMFFDWASQPYNTLLLTFIFGPYFAAIVANYFLSTGLAEEAADAKAQAIWSLGLTVTGLVIAFSAPILGALADLSGRRMPYIYFFSVLYVMGSFALWWTYPDASNFWLMLVMFGIGFIGMEFTTIFTNAMLPDLGTEEEIGKISGSGFAFGYWGGVLALFILLLLFVEQSNGKTLIGLDPVFGLVNADAKEGTRLVGPFSAIWFIVSMYFFFAWVKEKPRKPGATPARIGNAIRELISTLKSLPGRKSLSAYLGSSLLYRDALNGLYGFGGVYATLVLNWSITFVGIFGIIGAISAAFFSWVGGKADRKYGPKPVIVFCIIVLIGVCSIIVGMTRESFFGIPLAEGSQTPDIIFFVCGSIIGAAGGALQAASRTMMVRHADADKATEAFGLYALSGKATAFLAPGLITIATVWTQSPRLGISPLVGLFILGLIFLIWVNPKGVSKA
jgi:MFS transporter, UMF1 family